MHQKNSFEIGFSLSHQKIKKLKRKKNYFVEVLANLIPIGYKSKSVSTTTQD